MLLNLFYHDDCAFQLPQAAGSMNPASKEAQKILTEVTGKHQNASGHQCGT